MKQTIILEKGDGELWGRLSYDPGEDKEGFLHTTVGANVAEITQNIREKLTQTLISMVTRHLLAILIMLCLVSCDCAQIASGIILDKSSKKPIQDVTVSKVFSNNSSSHYQSKYLSDTLGRFRVHYIVGSTLFVCPDLKLNFSKKGYSPQNVIYKSISKDDTIYLEKVR